MLKRIHQHLNNYLEVYLASFFLVAFSVLVVLQVFMRYVMNSPLSWSEELARFALVWFVWIAGSYAVKFQRHVKFTVLVNLLGKKFPVAQRLLNILVFLIWLGFLLIMTYLSWNQVADQAATGQVSAAARVPMSVAYFGLTLGIALMALRVIQHTVLAITDLIKNPNEPIVHVGDVIPEDEILSDEDLAASEEIFSEEEGVI